MPAGANVPLTRVGRLLLAHDAPGDRAAGGEIVLGPGPASRTLADLTPRCPARTALDVGTGCGVQALLAAEHCEHVVATDTNPRALAYAAANARRNGIANVMFRRGSLLEPVGGERFDLLVSNPPFVISPEATFAFRDGGFPYDALSAEVVASSGAHLTDGGIGVVLCNWIEPRDELWWRRPRDWVLESGCDALLLRFATVDAEEYARMWNGPPAWRHGGGDPRAVERWRAAYRVAGITRVGMGAVVLRRRPTARTWLRALDVPHPTAGSAGAHVLRIVAAADEATAPAPLLLDSIVRFVPERRLEWPSPARLLVRLDPGLGVRLPVDDPAARVVAAFDGQRSVRQLLALSVTPEVDGGDADRRVVAAVLRATRGLLALGMAERVAITATERSDGQ